ncbi:hypothetical protein ACHAXT_005000 [Thalassiosira profunda]
MSIRRSSRRGGSSGGGGDFERTGLAVGAATATNSQSNPSTRKETEMNSAANTRDASMAGGARNGDVSTGIPIPIKKKKRLFVGDCVEYCSAFKKKRPDAALKMHPPIPSDKNLAATAPASSQSTGTASTQSIVSASSSDEERPKGKTGETGKEEPPKKRGRRNRPLFKRKLKMLDLAAKEDAYSNTDANKSVGSNVDTAFAEASAPSPPTVLQSVETATAPSKDGGNDRGSADAIMKDEAAAPSLLDGPRLAESLNQPDDTKDCPSIDTTANDVDGASDPAEWDNNSLTTNADENDCGSGDAKSDEKAEVPSLLDEPKSVVLSPSLSGPKPAELPPTLQKLHDTDCTALDPVVPDASNPSDIALDSIDLETSEKSNNAEGKSSYAADAPVASEDASQATEMSSWSSAEEGDAEDECPITEQQLLSLTTQRILQVQAKRTFAQLKAQAREKARAKKAARRAEPKRKKRKATYGTRRQKRASLPAGEEEEEPVEIVEMETGTLYLYRGEKRRAKFDRKV